MRLWQIVLLALLQGVPEFLPILRRETMPDHDHNPLEGRETALSTPGAVREPVCGPSGASGTRGASLDGLTLRERTQDHRTIWIVQRPRLSKSRANRPSSGMRLSGSYTMNRIWALAGYFVRSAAMPSDAFDGDVDFRMYLASMKRSESDIV